MKKQNSCSCENQVKKISLDSEQFYRWLYLLKKECLIKAWDSIWIQILNMFLPINKPLFNRCLYNIYQKLCKKRINGFEAQYVLMEENELSRLIEVLYTQFMFIKRISCLRSVEPYILDIELDLNFMHLFFNHTSEFEAELQKVFSHPLLKEKFKNNIKIKTTCS